jgi:signal transduction histidine kinase
MNEFLNGVNLLLTNPPGNVVYYLLLISSIAGSLQGTIGVLRSGTSLHARRALAGLIILLVLQLIPFILSPFAWANLLDHNIVFPPIDRAFTLLSLIWIAWLWIFPKPAPKADVATVILSLLTLFMLGVSLTLWVLYNYDADFNHSFQDNLWQIFTLAFIFIALVVLLFKRPTGFGYGMATLVLAGTGHLIHFLSPGSTGYISGIIRFFQITMYTLLVSLPQFLTEQGPVTPTLVPIDTEKQSFQERRRFSTDPKTFNSLFSLAAETETDQIGPNITRAIAQSMLADLVFLILIDGDKKLNIACGYDLIREEVLDGTVVDKESIPLLSNAILRGRPLRLPASNNSADIQGLGQIIGLSNPGSAMSIPVETSTRGGVIGAILLLSPYSNRVWSADDQSYLTNISKSIVPIMARSQHLAVLSRERDAALSQVAELQERYQAQDSGSTSAQELTARNQLLTENLASLTAALEQAKNEIVQLQEEHKALQSSPNKKSSVSKQSEIEQQFRMTLEELAHLQNELAESRSRIYDLEQKPATSSLPDDQVEVLASISQELRQPMSSIVGYTDLLLGESVGILGALQRKFLERVKASTERIGRLIEDLIQITSIETGRMAINPEIIDLNLIIDNAVAYTSTQLREKNITMRLDIPESPPKIHIDREALQQILIHLLQNAGAATLVEGAVTLRVKFQEETGKDYLMIQVVDSGGGIPAEDLPRVFSRRYRADNVLIQGLGDTGVGLSIARTLAEAQSGRIWVETTQGVGSTISALLPIESEPAEEED